MVYLASSLLLLSQTQRDSLPLQTSSLPTPTPISASTTSSSSSSSRISPAVLFIIVILAVIFFVSGLLHLLVRFLIKKNPSSSSSSSPHSHNHNQDLSNSDALQRQLQQLFHLHDSGLDQAFIDALPVFLYREIVGSKEPFDCAVCLCEFSQDDQLRLLPVCGHAFHLSCIDTWLLSNSTCPLCRGALFIQGVAIENPIFDFEEDARLEEGVLGREAEEVGGEKRVVPVRLGKFRSTSNENDQDGACGGDGDGNGNRIVRREEGESSSSNLDARRCYSMGSYQYVVGDANLRVALNVGDRNGRRGRGREFSGNLPVCDEEGKRLGVARKGESFSVSKIWLWGNKKGKFPDSSDASSLDGGLPWMNARRSAGDV